MAQAQGFDVLLGAAAFLPMSSLDVSKIKPEFMIMSWYKMFSFPTGVGCLLAHKSALLCLNRPWFSGGTVEAVSVGIPWHRLKVDESAFEDGTLNFHVIPEVATGLDWIQSAGMTCIHRHVHTLTTYLFSELMALRHTNSLPMCIVYGPEDMTARGGCLSFNLLDSSGKIVDERIVGEEASQAEMSIRAGCFCNPGVGENVFQLKAKRLRSLLWAHSPSIDEYIRLLKLPSAGAIRVSFGIALTMNDADRFLHFVRSAYHDRIVCSEGLPPREWC